MKKEKYMHIGFAPGSGSGAGKNKKGWRRLPPSAPYIAFGVNWALFALFSPFYRLSDFVFNIIFGGIVAFIFSLFTQKQQPKPQPQPVRQRVQEHAAELDKSARTLHSVGEAIKDPFVRDYAFSISSIIGRIADNIEANPIDSKKSRTFTKHYIPTVISIFERYSNLEKQHVSGGNITASMAHIIDSLDDIENVCKKQLDDMFDDDVLDIKTDLDVLTAMMENDM